MIGDGNTRGLGNPFKMALRENRTQLGLWSSLCSPLAAEALAQSSFDWILFDAEHSPVEIAGLLPLLQAAGNGRAAPVVRPPWNDAVLIKRVLDIGATTVLVPFVENEKEARRAAAAVAYPPAGRRGVAGVTRASRFGRDRNYLQNARDDICLLVQVETKTALAQIERIAAVEGVDGVFIGPSDLSASFDCLGEPSAPQVQEAIREACTRIRSTGKAAGILAGGAEDARRYLDWGFHFVACAVDLKLLVDSVDALYADSMKYIS